MAQNDTIVSDLIFNSMSQAEFNAQMQAETLDPNQFYLTPDDTNEKFEEIDTKVDETVANIEELSARIDTYSDTEFIARQVIASNRYIDLTLGASGESYTAPAEGWLVLNKLSSGTSYQFVQFYNTKNADRRIGAATTNNAYLCATMPLAKGDRVLVEYSATGDTKLFRFIYANGAK